MTTQKEEILKIVNDLPDDATLEDAIYNLIFYSKLQKSNDDIKNGRVMTLEESKERMMKKHEDFDVK